MIGQKLGPYTIDAELGSGGMGTVYKATGPDGPVALKVVHPHLLSSPGFFKRFLREAEVGRKVVHENVVRTFDFDALVVDDKQVNFLVMEYVEGRSLRELLEELGTVPETLLRELAVQIAAGLDAIHAAGIIHRDLKPENVLITNDYQVRIMDLGVARLQEASLSLTHEGQFAGSVLYAAPEQFASGKVGPPVDLYALGVVLYELATGENPFRRDAIAAVIEAQRKHQPPRLTERGGEVTDYFAEVVATLLAKKTEERFASAELLHTVLGEGERSAWWAALAPMVQEEIARLPKIRVRRETELYGRASELAALVEAWGRAREGDGNTVFLEGEAGIGKTRLVDAFLRGLPDAEVHVLYGSYPPSGGLGGMSDAILDKFGEIDLAAQLAPYLTVTPSLVPAFAALIKHESPPTGAEPLTGNAQQAVCVHLMRAMAAEKPLVWVVEDAHFAPKESRDLVLALARAVEGHPSLLVVTARPGIPEDEQAHFSRLENCRRVPLSRLGGRETIELLQDAFHSEMLAEKLGGSIALKSDGVPFFVFEMIRGLKEGRFIQEQADGTYLQTRVVADIEVPSAVKDLIEGRLQGITEQQRMILDAGAVAGLTFDPGLVATVLEEKRVRVLQQLAEVERRFGLVHGEAGLCRFDQNQIQEVIYRDLMPDLRAEYHTLLAEAFAARLKGEAVGEDAVFLASHHLRGSRPEEGLAHLTPAIEFLAAAYRNEAAVELATLALERPGLLEGPDRVEVLLSQAQRYWLRGEQEPLRVAVDEALALADASGETTLRARARIQLGRRLLRTADFPAARACLEEALDLARSAGAKRIEGHAMGNLGGTAWNQGRYDEANVYFEQCLTLATELGDPHGEVSALGNLANVLLRVGQYDRALAHYERAIALAQKNRYREGEAIATGNLGGVFTRQGRYEEAQACYERHLELSREIGNRRGEAFAQGNVGNVLAHQGRLQEAQACYERALAVLREIGDRQGAAFNAGNLGSTLLFQGRLEQSRVLFGEWLEMAREIGDRRQEAYALGSLSSLAYTEDDFETALTWQEQALALRRELGERDGVADSLIALGLIHTDGGGHVLAIPLLDEALALARELETPRAILLASVYRARSPGGNLDAAIAALAAHEGHVSYDVRIEARFALWELTGDRAHLTEAHRLLLHGLAHTPEAHQDSMRESVPIHRKILEAWAAQDPDSVS